MTDKELLGLAAKAMEYKYTNGALWDGRDVVEYSWNPIENDDHALRVAVKLRLNVECSVTTAHVISTNFEGVEEQEPVESDRYAATRRAIVRAAAEIGRKAK